MKDPRRIVKRAHLTEKSARLMEKENKCFFIVDAASNKPEIKRAIEALFKVKVAKVQTMNYLGKTRRERTSKYGKRPDWKRAVVTLKQGEKFDFV